ncbi:MAG TPA: NAD(P)-dependent alcohol dehydrogenase [Candidatus Bathyarchaeia archaeon]|nr:NAD(P)-dependent alcohol dehydrogenase [Candidatus Bathyarchaeia archaeon]
MTEQIARPTESDKDVERTKMKAVIQTRYGPPEVLELREVDRPALADNRVLVRIHATSVNPADYHPMRGMFLARTLGRTGLRKPKDPRFGSDFSGTVEAIGKNVTQFKPGDEVYGVAPGAAAEYATPREDRMAVKPSNSSFEEAAAIPIAAFTALQAIRDRGHVQPGQRVLVNGASGGVGTFAVQIAKAFGAEVTGVTSTRNLEMVKKIGADHIIDYTREDFTKSGEKYDVIIDTIGNHSVFDYRRILTPTGTCVPIGFSGVSRIISTMIMGSLTSKLSSKKVGMMIAKSNQKDLIELKQLIESGRVKPVVDRTFPLSETADAVRYAEGPHHKPGHARGKVVITVE